MSDLALDTVLEIEERLNGNAHEEALPDNCIRLHSGVILQIIGIAQDSYVAIINEYARHEPKPPVVMLKSKGREEANPNDPAYIQNHNLWLAERDNALLNSIYVFGTRIWSIPDNVAGPDDASTIEDLELAGRLVRNTPKGRFVSWLMHCIKLTKEEKSDIFKTAGRQIGVMEADVSEAAKRP